ncbi:MAG: methionyl-tRNA formyltransferase [Syntrophobacteraceae bacterium]
MRIVVIGQAPFGAKTLEALLGAGEEVIAAYTPQDRPAAKPDPLKEAALKHGVRLFQPKSYRGDHAFREYVELRPDLVVLAFVTDIIPTRYFEAATLGAICYHPSLLPRHRGASGINWALIMGDARTGLTVFWPDEGIDTGPILLQKEIEIGPDDTAGSLYFDRLFPMGIEAMVESVGLIKAGKAPKIPQDEAGATYEPPCDDRVAAIDWDKSGREIYNLVRGCDPQPGAYADFKGEKVRFYGARFIGAGPGDASGMVSGAASGTVSGVDEKGVRIAVPGGELLVSKVRPASTGKIDAAQWAATGGVKVGERFAAFRA